MAEQATGTVEGTGTAGALAHGSGALGAQLGQAHLLGRDLDRHHRVHHRRHRVRSPPALDHLLDRRGVAIVGCLILAVLQGDEHGLVLE